MNTNYNTYTQNQGITNVENLNAYYESRLIVNINIKDSIVFQWFGIDGYIQKLVTSKYFLYSLLICAIIGLIIAFTFLILDGPNIIYYAVLGAVFCVGLVIHVMVLLNSHKLLYCLIFNTFDFWFIMWNTVNVLYMILSIVYRRSMGHPTT